MQIWDNDLFSPDDFIGEHEFSTIIKLKLSSSLPGTLDFNLNAISEPTSTADKCTLEQFENEDRKISDLFKRKRIKGWWPSYKVDDEGNKLLKVSRFTSKIIL